MLLLLLAGGISAPAASTGATGGDGKRRVKHRNGDDELTEAELQFMRRKLRQLREAKTERERLAAAKELEVSLAQVAGDEEAAETISETIHSAPLPARIDYASALRDATLIAKVIARLQDMLVQREHERARQQDEEETELFFLTS